MKRLVKLFTASLLVAAVFVFGLIVAHPLSAPADLAAAAPIARDAVKDIIEAREQEIEKNPDVPFGDKDTINILALGIDSRKEGDYAHCDAIHMISLNLKDWTITITSVPRGTTSPLPPGREYLVTDYYLSNACYFGGLPYGIKQIEKVAGVKADYVATVGFSEALGMFRALDLPTTDTLEFLRHRRSYQIGDPQRSHNQGLFIKDTALKLLSSNHLPAPFLYILYSFVHTDMDFNTVKALYDAYYTAHLGEHPDSVTLVMKPFYPVTDIHYDPEHAPEQVGKLIDFLKGKVSPVDLSLKPLGEVQAQLVTYLRDALADDEAMKRVFAEQMWRQVEDQDVREELQYRYLDKYVLTVNKTDPEGAQKFVTDYILEKEYFGLTVWENKGKKLLGEITK